MKKTKVKLERTGVGQVRYAKKDWKLQRTVTVAIFDANLTKNLTMDYYRHGKLNYS